MYCVEGVYSEQIYYCTLSIHSLRVVKKSQEDEAHLNQFSIVTKIRKFSSWSVVGAKEAESAEKPRRYRRYATEPHLRDPVKSAKSDVTSRKSSTKRSSWHGTSHQHNQQKKIQLEEVTVNP